MDPMTIAALVSAGSSIFGGIQSSNANAQNAQIAMLNYYAQQQAQQQALAEARRQRGEAHLGQTDAAGNRIYFVPGRGWVTELSDDQRAIQQGTEDEQIRALTTGAQRAERVAARGASRREGEDVLAEAAENELRRMRPAETGRLRELFLARGAEERNRAADATGDVVARQALRMGGGANAAELMTRARGASDASGARQAGVDATLQAMQEGERQFDHSRDRASKLYDYFRRASTTGAASPQGFSPTGPERLSTGVADQGLINALGRAPQQEYRNPNLALTDTANDLAALYSGYRQQQRDDELLNIFKQRLGTNKGSIS